MAEPRKHLSLDADATEVDGVNGHGDEEYPRLHYPEHGARCVEGGAEKSVSQSMTTMHWELAALRSPEELRGEDGG